MGLKKFTIGADATELYPISVESKKIRRWRLKNKKKYMGTYSVPTFLGFRSLIHHRTRKLAKARFTPKSSISRIT